MNLLENLNPQQLAARALSWDHEPARWEALPDGGLRVQAPAKADYFRDPAGAIINDQAPFLWMSVTGDFVARAHVRPTFANTYDSGVLMARHDERNWAKICFEKTDFGTTAAVSVVTRETSDDANGANVTTPALWLQMSRVGDVFALHYSQDGQTWNMVRIFRLPVPPTIKVGIVAQSPVGPGTTVDFLYFNIEQRTIKNQRAGV